MYETLKQARKCMTTNYLMAKYIAPFVRGCDIGSDVDYDILSVLTFGIVRNNPDKSIEELGELVERYYGG